MVDWIWYLHQDAMKWSLEEMEGHKSKAFSRHAEAVGVVAKPLQPVAPKAVPPAFDGNQAEVAPVKRRISGKGGSKRLYGEVA